MWATHPSCGDIVAQEWTGSNGGGAVDCLIGKVQECAKELIAWNVEQFRHVKEQIKKLEQSLRLARDFSSRKAILADTREWHRQEEILWRQRACSDD